MKQIRFIKNIWIPQQKDQINQFYLWNNHDETSDDSHVSNQIWIVFFCTIECDNRKSRGGGLRFKANIQSIEIENVSQS
jgi:hypothetical protein